MMGAALGQVAQEGSQLIPGEGEGTIVSCRTAFTCLVSLLHHNCTEIDPASSPINFKLKLIVKKDIVQNSLISLLSCPS